MRSNAVGQVKQHILATQINFHIRYYFLHIHTSNQVTQCQQFGFVSWTDINKILMSTASCENINPARNNSEASRCLAGSSIHTLYVVSCLESGNLGHSTQ